MAEPPQKNEPLSEEELAELVDPNDDERRRWLCYRAVLEIKELRRQLEQATSDG